MADYHPLISRAVAGLDTNTGEARRALYERARAALVGQLRGVTPALSESDITRERLALEEAIRKVEAEQARRGRIERAPKVGMPQGAEAAQADLSHPPRRESIPASLLQGLEEESRPDGRPMHPAPADEEAPAAPAVAEPEIEQRAVPGATADLEEAPGTPDRASTPAPQDELSDVDRPLTPPATATEPPPAEQDLRSAATKELESAQLDEALRKLRRRLVSGEGEEVVPQWPRVAPPNGRQARNVDGSDRRVAREEREHEPDGRDVARVGGDEVPADQEPGTGYADLPLRSQRRWSGLLVKTVIAVVVLGVLGALAAVGYRERGSLIALYHLLRGPPVPVTREEARTLPKIEDRIGPGQPDRLPGSDQRASAPATQPPPAVAQRVVLYEEDPNDPNGKRYVGSVIWRTETISPGPGLAPELAVKGSIEIPERRITMSFSMVRNTDTALPASHTIDVRFNLPPGFSGGGVANVPGILMKQAEQTRGVPLAGIAVKVTNNVFLIGLSSVDADVQRNTQLLKERTWFDIPIVYSNGSRAILAMEKGTPGERAFNDAFTAWGRPSTAAR
jgi:hypothetical protein